ncbi:MAG TPA: HEAT repeat domain-containing protein, partial [Gemmataceae bacterium]|nr:HEAT repeat domain-containing protein [Gemmataceae bacterium]
MRAPRLLGLLILALFVAVAAVSAQPGLPPGVKLPTVIKPGGGPGMPQVKPAPPPVKTPPTGQPAPGGKDSGTPGGGTGSSTGTPGFPGGGGAGAVEGPGKKKDPGNWPKEINGKTPEMIVKEMRTNSDPAAREAAVRTLPLFGPKGRAEGADDLVEVMNRDQDWNVRLAAVSVAPTVLYALADAPDTPLAQGLTAIVNLMVSENMNARYDAVNAIAAFGPYARNAQPKAISTLTTRAREFGSWQMRRAAAAALGAVGQGYPQGEPGKRVDPDSGAVTALLDVLKGDNCAAVRREAVNSLILMGPVASGQQKKWRSDLDFVIGKEKDKSVLLWTRVCVLRNDPGGVEKNKSHLDEVAKVLEAIEPGGRVEACQALALLGEEAKSKLQKLLDVIQNKDEKELVVAA